MATISSGATSSITLTGRQTIAFTLSQGERVAVRVVRGSTVICSNLVSSDETIGPFALGDVVTMTAVNGDIDYTLAYVGGVSFPVMVDASRTITSSDDGMTLECTATVTLTVPTGLPAGFGCIIIPSGTTSIASSGGALLNGATTTLTRAAASNSTVAIIGRASAADSYVVTGS